jgi:hypothetical protein
MLRWSPANKASLAKWVMLCGLLVTQSACLESEIVDTTDETDGRVSDITSIDNSSRSNSNQDSGKLRLVLAIDQASMQRGSVVLRATISNQSSTGVSFLKWNTPFDLALNGRFLKIVHVPEAADTDPKDVELDYVGRMVKRAPATADDYISLGTGDVAENDLDLMQSYNFCNESRYSLKFVGSFYTDDFVLIQFVSNAVAFETARTIGSC